ncbi:transglycosylase domain-containing protein [Viscerimonas tarda]
MKKAKPSIPVSLILRIFGITLIAVFLSSILWVAFYSKFDVEHTPQMAFYKFGHHDDSLNYKVEHCWIPIDSMSRNVIIAVLAGEDNNFYVHDGFSPINEDDSLIRRIPKEHETITQKAAHSVFLTKGDSKVKDLLEPYFTILEEYLWGKDRILEIYLNTSLVGNGIFGVEAASQIYFNKPAGDLTKYEAAYIAALMEHNKTIDIEHPDEELLARQKDILLKMAFMIHVKLGKKPVDESGLPESKPIYRRAWRG